MRQYKLCIENDDNNNNNIIIIIIKWINQKIKGRGQIIFRKERREGREFIFNIFSLLFFLRSTKIEPQVLVGTESKVDLRDESYAWTPKSWSFIKLHEVGNFPTCVISSLKAI